MHENKKRRSGLPSLESFGYPPKGKELQADIAKHQEHHATPSWDGKSFPYSAEDEMNCEEQL